MDDSKLVILRFKEKIHISHRMEQAILNEMMRQRDSGVMLIPDWLEVILAPKDVEIVIENAEVEHGSGV
jgi:hypothetical protein